MRTHLTKSLQTRCKAIQNAVDKFNVAAKASGRPTLTWAQVSQYSFLEQFTLLRETREDVLAKKWTKPQYRLTMHQNRRIRHAKEEIQRLNVEIRRLHTSMVDEEIDVTNAVQEVRVREPLLTAALEEWWAHRQMVNGHLMAGLRRIYALDGFTGNSTPGVRIGRSAASRSPVTLPDVVVEEEDLVEHPDDDAPRELQRGVYDFIAELSRGM